MADGPTIKQRAPYTEGAPPAKQGFYRVCQRDLWTIAYVYAEHGADPSRTPEELAMPALDGIRAYSDRIERELVWRIRFPAFPHLDGLLSEWSTRIDRHEPVATAPEGVRW